MEHIPRILNCAAVKVFAVLETATQPVSRPMVTQVAVCRRSAPPLFAVFGCDNHWQTLYSELFDSIDRAIDYAEHIYPGLADRWLSPQAAVTLRKSEEKYLSCAFCGHHFSQAEQFFLGTFACICPRCVDEFYHQVHKKDRFVRYMPGHHNLIDRRPA